MTRHPPPTDLSSKFLASSAAAYYHRSSYSALGAAGGAGGGGQGAGGGCSPGAERRVRLVAAALLCHHCGVRDLPVLIYPDVVDHGPAPVDCGLPLLRPLFLKHLGVLRTADEVGCFILVGYVHPQLFGGALALVKRSGVFTKVHVRSVRPRGEEGGPDLQRFLVEDGRVRIDLFDH